jgi:hypothetical protein
VIGWDGISAQALSDTIGAIYDCTLDPQQRPDTRLRSPLMRRVFLIPTRYVNR